MWQRTCNIQYICSNSPLERDYFNLRKMVVVASLDGVLFGIDSGDGSILWRTNLGTGFSPLKNNLEEEKIPLFIQRSTSNYHLNGQAVVIFKDSVSLFGLENIVLVVWLRCPSSVRSY